MAARLPNSLPCAVSSITRPTPVTLIWFPEVLVFASASFMLASTLEPMPASGFELITFDKTALDKNKQVPSKTDTKRTVEKTRRFFALRDLLPAVFSLAGYLGNWGERLGASRFLIEYHLPMLS